jgi:O-antigen/teichoic acid export membrane protein
LIAQIQRLIKHSAIYGAGHILGRSITLLLMPLHTNYIPPEDYAAYVYGYAFISVAAIFYSAGINAAQMKFYIASNSYQEKRLILSTSFWGTFLFGIIFTTIIFLGASEFSELVFGHAKYNNLTYWSILILATDSLSLILFNQLRAEEKSLEFVCYNCINMIINICINFYLIIVLKKGVESIFIANAVASTGICIILVFVITPRLEFKFSFPIFKKLIIFGAPLIPSTLGMVILLAIDRFFIKAYIGDEAAGLYGAGYRLGMFMSLIVTAFKFAWHPFYLSLAETDTQANNVFSRVLTYFLFITSSIFIFVTLFINEIIRIKIGGITLLGEQYWSALPIVPLILASYIFYGIFLNLQVGPWVQNKTYFIIIATSLSATINMLMNMILIPIMGIMGAAVASFTSYVVLAMSLYLFTQHSYQIPYEWTRLLKLTLITIVFYFSGHYLISMTIPIKLMFNISYFIVLALSGFFLRSEFIYIKKLLIKNTRST